MGIYLNPGNENFRRATVADIYVDKTMLISEMNRFIDKANNYVCVSRPRRFGKTITSNMLAAYYSKGCDSRALFSKYKIAGTEDFDNKLNKYNVIQIDVNSEYQNTNDKDNLVRILSEKIIDELKQEYNSVKIKDEYTLGEAILAIYAATQDTFILLIDEYDVLVREKVSKKLFDDYLSFLNGLFKSNT